MEDDAADTRYGRGFGIKKSGEGFFPDIQFPEKKARPKVERAFRYEMRPYRSMGIYKQRGNKDHMPGKGGELQGLLQNGGRAVKAGKAERGDLIEEAIKMRGVVESL